MIVKVKIDLIEWYEDDIGQYQDKLPRSLDSVGIIVEEDTDEAASDALMAFLENAFRVKPVLIAWDRIPE